jgi:hypothetical protein
LIRKGVVDALSHTRFCLVCFLDSGDSNSILRHVLSVCPELRVLSMGARAGHRSVDSDEEDSTSVHNSHAAKLTADSLTSFSGIGGSFTQATLSALLTVTAPRLTALNLKGVAEVSDSLLSVLFSGRSPLTSLSVADCVDVTDTTVRSLARAAAPLHTLDLSWCSGTRVLYQNVPQCVCVI